MAAMLNDYTLELLQYSAERDYCISRPESWIAPPPLVVDTPLHKEMDDLADELWAGPEHLVWQFLVGGPGNGKSEAVGAFVRRINSNAAAAGKNAVFDAAAGQGGSSIAYDFQADLPSGGMWLIQDISVPRSAGSDPAMDLLACLDLCVNPGAHLLVCANRGMLLRATRFAREDPKYAWLGPALEAIDERSRETATAETATCLDELRGKRIETRVWPLDHESILFGQIDDNPWAEPAGSLLDQIIAKAASDANWEQRGCSQCPAAKLCPMFGDALWLRDPVRRRSLMKVLRIGEVATSQRVVLREALGLTALIFVGSPSDFVSSTGFTHPCEWVQSRVISESGRPKDSQALLELVAHRIYQDVFGRPTPTGLALDQAHHWRDGWILDGLRMLGSVGEAVAKTLLGVDGAFAKQTGPLRLVGLTGVLPPMDPAIDSEWSGRYGISTDGQIQELRQIGSTFHTQLEHELGLYLETLEEAAKTLAPHADPAKAFAAIYRWASVFYLRLAGLALGETPNQESLNLYLGLLPQPNRPFLSSGKQFTLRDLVRASSGATTAALVPNFTAELPALQIYPKGARPRSEAPRWPANDRLELRVTSGALPPLTVQLSANIFVDTWRKQVLGVAAWNIAPAIEKLMHAWRDDFLVSHGQFRNVPSVRFSGKKGDLEFEFVGPNDMLLRRR